MTGIAPSRKAAARRRAKLAPELMVDLMCRVAGRRRVARAAQFALKHAVPTWVADYPFATFPAPTGRCLSVLGALHKALTPRTYLEIGIRRGDSLARSRSRSIGIDPAYNITVELECDLRLFRTTSDEFFQRPDAFDHFAGTAVDFAFIDGMHLSEFALRDFMNVEKQMSAGGVIVFDDMLPRNSLEAYRNRRTRAWTGDVYKVHDVLEQYRPDLTIVPVNSNPTGIALVVNLDPTSTVLDEQYSELEKAITKPDPQVVPQERLERRQAVDAAQLTGLDVWRRLVELRDAGAGRDAFAPLWAELAALPRVGA